MRGSAVASLLVVASMALAPLTAVAQTPEVERLLRHGIELRQQGSNEAALAEFRHAHQLANTPRTLAQVALAEQALGRWVEAETHLREALRGANDPWIARNRTALDGAMGVIAQHVGLVMVRCDVDGAELWIGERRAGALPLTAPLRVDAGEVEVSVREGARRASQRVQVNAGETASVVLRLGHASGANQDPTGGAANDPIPSRGESVPSTSRPGATQRALGWVSLVGGVVGLGVGVGGYFVGQDGMSAYDDNPVDLYGRYQSSGSRRCPGSDAPVQPGECRTWLDQVNTGNTMLIAGGVAGGVLALTGIILLVSAPSATVGTTQLACAPSPGQLGLNCGGRF